MQNTNASERYQAQRLYITTSADHQEIKVGKIYSHGRYEFEVLSDDAFSTVISVRYNGRGYRTIRFDKGLKIFVPMWEQNMSDVLLEALCLVFINHTTVEAKDARRLYIRRACTYQNSWFFEHGSPWRRRKCPNPFGFGA